MNTKFTLTAASVMTDAEQLEVIQALEPIRSRYGLKGDVDVRHPAFSAKVSQDYDVQSPRDCRYNDICDVIYFHKGFRLSGDEGADPPFEEVEGKHIDGQWMTEDELDQAMGYFLENSYFEVYDELRDAPFDTETQLRSDIAICIPVSFYDHGGITVFHGSPTCRWDSGGAGWHYMTKAKLAEEFNGDEELAKKYMEASIKEYDHYVQGNVWGFQVFDEDDEEVEGCWGFIGSELEETGMLEHVSEEHRQLVTDAWEKRFDG